MSAPARSPEERSRALEAALAARQERARLRVALKSRELSPLTVLDEADDNPLWANLKVTWLLECLPGIGTVRADRILTDAQIAPSRRIQGLGIRQRAALVAELEREGR
ncbi:MAG: integration host factor, actinobacterial type [Actinomycetes bacterium]